MFEKDLFISKHCVSAFERISRNEFVLLVFIPKLSLFTNPLRLFIFIFRFQIPPQPIPSHKVYLKHGTFTIDLGKSSVDLICVNLRHVIFLRLLKTKLGQQINQIFKPTLNTLHFENSDLTGTDNRPVIALQDL